jgi:hypothetical protein
MTDPYFWDILKKRAARQQQKIRTSRREGFAASLGVRFPWLEARDRLPAPTRTSA